MLELDRIRKSLTAHREILAQNIPSKIDFHKDISKELGMNFFIKREDVLGKYGGNKVRKLEFLYPTIDKKNVFMFGPTGSHHLVANLIYGKDRFDFISVIFPTYLYKMRNSYVLEKTEIVKMYSKKVIFTQSMPLAFALTYVLSKIKNGFFIPPGSSSPRTSLGFVLSAIEIYESITKNEIPEPDFIFLPAGTGGTIAGLLAGLNIVGLKSQIIGVQVVETCREFIVKKFCNLVLKELKKIVNDLNTNTNHTKANLKIIRGFIGKGYGYPTEDGIKAKEFFERFGIKSELTYTAKTLSAILHMKEKFREKNVLFYYTLNTLNTKM
ncbi:MAG: pyridoxal-phosphate dependent enzyme [Candidatus Calescibacterium sp.]|nr:pyridoxal-phosphate dependent enzyme [Candidatus Calescibacterium sp.]